MPASPQRYLITGGAGFIGSHLAEALLAAGHQVAALDDLSTGRLANIAHLLAHPRFAFTQGSVLEPGPLESLIPEGGVVVHLAAAVGVKLVVERPVHALKTNVLGAERILECAERRGVKRLLLASSSEVYGKGARIPFAEDDDVLIGPTNRARWGYAASKMLDEFLALAYFQERKLPVVVTRFFNTVGPRQTGAYGMVVPRFVRSALRGEPIEVYGDGTQSRCFCDVRDVVRAVLGLAEHPQAPGQVFNIGSMEEISIRALAEEIAKLAGSKSSVRLIPYSQAYAPGFEDMTRRVPDISRIGALLSWKPERNLAQILHDVIEYEKAAGV